MFRIPIKEYEKDMNTEAAKMKKKEIIELFMTFNHLRSEEEFYEVRQELHRACQKGDLELIKIYLNETILNEREDLKFKINKTTHTASLFKIDSSKNKDIIIPRTVKHEYTDYIITSIGVNCLSDIKTIKFSEDSSVKTIYENDKNQSEIEEIYLPSSLCELKEGWCHGTRKLTKISISPSNDHFILKNFQYLIGKSDENNNEFDNLLFAVRDIEEISIPSNIKNISSYSFEYCQKLNKVEISSESNLETIGKHAFSFSNIKEFFIPSKVVKIKDFSFFACRNLEKVEFSQDSNLQTIESDAFSSTIIKEIYFPSKLKELNNGWCSHTNKLTKIIISPLNDHFVFKNDQYLLGKSDENKDEFDVLLFVRRDIKEFSIPSNIKIIASGSFDFCQNLRKVNFSPDSKLEIIGSHAFSFSKIKEISIPSTVTKISEYAFYACNCFIRIEFPLNSNLQTIGQFAFSLSIIREIHIPSNLTKIYRYAFDDCDNLVKVSIPQNSNLKTIGTNAFSGSQIREIYFPSSLCELKERWFDGAKKLTKISISPLNDHFILKDEKCLIGKSDINDNKEFDNVLFAVRDIEEISIPSNIKYISSYAFEYCEKLRKVKIPRESNLEMIGKDSFSKTNIRKIFIPSKVTKICGGAFSSCNLKIVEIAPNSNLQIIGYCAFENIEIEMISIPSKVTKICEGAFSNCYNLTRVDIQPDSNLQIIGSDAFFESSIKYFFVPPKVSKISNGAFENCNNLQIVEFSEELKLESFPFSAFPIYTNLIIMIPSTLKMIGLCK